MNAARKTVAYLVLVLAVLSGFAPAAFAEDRWFPTWAAAPHSQRIVFPVTAPPAGVDPATLPPPPVPRPIVGFNNQTVRMVIRTSIGGRRARVQFTNAFNTTSLRIGAAHLAVRDKESAIVARSDRALTFNGKPGVTIPAGVDMLSDPVDIDVPQLGDMAISVYVPGDVTDPTVHFAGLHTTYVSKPGDFTGAPAIADTAATNNAYFMISAVQVQAPETTGVIVAFGDSITDGATSTPNTNNSYPAQLARRVLANKATSNLAVINEGIGGNKILGELGGIPALARFDRDVLAQPGVKWLIVMEGINDVGFGAPGAPTADDLIAGHRQLIERAHMHGIKVIGATLTPYAGAFYYREDGEGVRTAVNAWIRGGKAYDAFIDFDAVVRDPKNPKQILPAYNNSDHLHPNDAGYKAMADAVDLSLFISAQGNH